MKTIRESSQPKKYMLKNSDGYTYRLDTMNEVKNKIGGDKKGWNLLVNTEGTVYTSHDKNGVNWLERIS